MIGRDDISLCAIFRNEERLLPSFLERHASLFGEIVLVDTGSTDRSGEIVGAHGLPHHHFPWTGSFSQARNYSLGLAGRPFICVLDIDEVLLPGDLDQALGLLGAGAGDGLSLRQINLGFCPPTFERFPASGLPAPFCTLAAEYSVSRLIRIFRNDPRVRFEGVVHEIVGNSLHAAGFRSQITDIPVYHLGWLDCSRTAAEQEEKVGRYRAMIRRAYAEDPSVHNGYYLLTTAESAGERLRMAYELVRRYPAEKDFAIALARSAAESGQWPRALEYARRGLDRFPDSTSLSLLRIQALNQCGWPQEALAAIDRLGADSAETSDFLIEKVRALLLLGRRQQALDIVRDQADRFPADSLTTLQKLTRESK